MLAEVGGLNRKVAHSHLTSDRRKKGIVRLQLQERGAKVEASPAEDIQN